MLGNGNNYHIFPSGPFHPDFNFYFQWVALLSDVYILHLVGGLHKIRDSLNCYVIFRILHFL